MKLNQLNLTATLLMPLLAFPACADAPLKDWQFEAGASATAARAYWKTLTSGEELARGKKVEFFPPPHDDLTTDENDPYDLTDGTLSSRLDDRIWFNKDAVGWYGGIGTSGGVLMLIDLGTAQDVGQIAIRVLGGHEQSALDLPQAIEFLASNDGKAFHSLQLLPRLNLAEAELAKENKGFYYPQEGKAYTAPVVCHTGVRTRYIALRATLQNSLFTDQISIQKAKPGTAIKPLSEFPAAQVYTDGLVVMPRHAPLTVTTNIATPNWFTVIDNSGLDLKKSKAGFRLELPRGLRVLTDNGLICKDVTPPDSSHQVYQYEYDGKNRLGSIGPVWIVKEKGTSIPKDATAKLTATLDGADSHLIATPLQLVEIPEIEPLKGLEVSLAWNHDAQQQSWPHFLNDFRKMGFGYVSTFPYYFRKTADGQWNETARKNLQFLKEARVQGYKIVSNDSPFHVMWDVIEADQKAGKISDEQAHELYNQIGGKRGKWFNILYRGKYYQDEIKRVAEMAVLVDPDHLYFDIEWWPPVVVESQKDPRVIEAWQKSGKTWNEFLTDMGTDILTDIVTAVRAATPNRKIIFGLYNSDPINQVIDSIFQWDKIYPRLIDIAMPSIYIQADPIGTAKRVRYDYQSMQNRQIIPWLSTGTYGEHAPSRTQPMVLETILNGSIGFTYYWFGDFDPMDFYYHTNALKTLKPFEKLLQEGKPIPYRGDNPDFHYTAFAGRNEALLLIGNYSGSKKHHVTLPLNFGINAKTVTAEGKALPIRNNSVTLDIPANEYRLLHIK